MCGLNFASPVPERPLRLADVSQAWLQVVAVVSLCLADVTSVTTTTWVCPFSVGLLSHPCSQIARRLRAWHSRRIPVCSVLVYGRSPNRMARKYLANGVLRRLSLLVLAVVWREPGICSAMFMFLNHAMPAVALAPLWLFPRISYPPDYYFRHGTNDFLSSACTSGLVLLTLCFQTLVPVSVPPLPGFPSAVSPLVHQAGNRIPYSLFSYHNNLGVIFCCTVLISPQLLCGQHVFVCVRSGEWRFDASSKFCDIHGFMAIPADLGAAGLSSVFRDAAVSPDGVYPRFHWWFARSIMQIVSQRSITSDDLRSFLGYIILDEGYSKGNQSGQEMF
ncbi:hypothetical protein NPIL_13081 [Nephila pilipes]|uniref:Uncharacterized protein n=1 Tax=Nephila pilipes TaxID=299642 RepID=A0A8X6UBW8_NEPPI|nr:hypothetical protein NPIL_13081 [Nephila pilipes]